MSLPVSHDRDSLRPAPELTHHHRMKDGHGADEHSRSADAESRDGCRVDRDSRTACRPSAGRSTIAWSAAFQRAAVPTVLILLLVGCDPAATTAPTTAPTSDTAGAETPAPGQPVGADDGPASPVPASPAPGGPMERGQAAVDALELQVLESFPVQVRAVVRGTLSDTCTEVSEVSQTQSGQQFELTAHTIRPEEAMCAQQLVPYEHTVALDTRGLAAGTYTVTAGAASETFTLQADNEAPAAPTALDTTGWVQETFETLGLSIEHPPHWTVEREPGRYLLAPAAADAPWLTLGLAVELPAGDRETLSAALRSQLEADGAATARTSPMLLDGVEGVLVVGRPDSCLEVYIPAATVVRRVRVSSAVCDAGGMIAEPEAQRVLDTVGVFAPSEAP